MAIKFDCVVVVDVLYAIRLTDWPTFLSYCRGQLEAGGTLILKETTSRPRWKALLSYAQETLAISVLRYTKGDAPHFQSEDVYLQSLRSCGFELLSSRRVDRRRPWPHHLIVARSLERPHQESE